MRGVITLVFDDGYEAVYEQVVPLLDELGFPGVFALPLKTNALATTVPAPVRPWPEWLPIRARGHEIAAHSITHTDLRQLPLPTLKTELAAPHEALAATTLIYPGGAANDQVVAEAKKLYTAARTTTYGFENIPPVDPWRLKTVDYTQDNFSVLKANARVLWASLTGAWLIETYHMVYPTAAVDKTAAPMHHSVSFEDLARHLKFIQKLSLPVKTINETIRDSHN